MPVNSIDDIWAVICEECKKTISDFAFDVFHNTLLKYNTTA